MKRNLSTSLLSSVFVAGMIVAGSVSAQQATKPLPAGDTATGTSQTQRPSGTMPQSRAAVKSETRAANRTPDGTLPAGNSETVGGRKMDGPPAVMSGKSREGVKADTRAAVRTPNATLPAGNSETIVPSTQRPPAAAGK